MTTETSGTPQPPVMEVAEVYRVLGRLEEGQSQIKGQLNNHEQRFGQIEQRLYQLLIAIVGFSVAILVTLVAIIVRLGFGGD